MSPLIRYCLNSGPFWTSKNHFQSQHTAFQRVIPSDCVGGYRVFWWGILNSDFFGISRGERGRREECDERAWAAPEGLPGVKELWFFWAPCVCVLEIRSLKAGKTKPDVFSGVFTIDFSFIHLCLHTTWTDNVPYPVHWTASYFLQWAGLFPSRTSACTHFWVPHTRLGWKTNINTG